MEGLWTGRRRCFRSGLEEVQGLRVPVNKKALYVQEEHKQEYEKRIKEKMNNEQMKEQSLI